MKISFALTFLAFISMACRTQHRDIKSPVEETETIVPVTDTTDTTDTKVDNTKPDAVVPKAEINGKSVATCRKPRGPFVLCESGQTQVLHTVSMQADYPDLIGKRIEVQVSFQGTIKAGEVFSLKADELAKVEIPDATNPVLKLNFIAPAQFDLSIGSLLENNPQPMDADFSVDLKDMKVVIIPAL